MARTIEAFAAYHRKKELLTDYLQVASAGLGLLRRNIAVPNAPALLGALVDACDVKHWGKGKHYKSALEKVQAAQSSLADHGVIQQVAAFDVFTRQLIQDVARFSERARQTLTILQHDHELLRLSPSKRWVSHHCCNDVASKLDSLSKRLDELQTWLSWTPSKALQDTLPAFDLIRSVRNRIAHGDGIVGSELEELASSTQIADALGAFRRTYARADLPKLPPFVRGKPLQLDTVHSILFGAILYEIAKELNSFAAQLLTDEELIDMAFYYSCIVEEHPFRTIRHRSPENRVAYFLAERYSRDGKAPPTSAVIRRLTSVSLHKPTQRAYDSTYWRVALERHKALLGAPTG